MLEVVELVLCLFGRLVLIKDESSVTLNMRYHCSDHSFLKQSHKRKVMILVAQ